MKYFNPKIEELMQTGVRQVKRAGEYALIGAVVLAPTIGLGGCAYFKGQSDSAVHAVQNSGQQEEPVAEQTSPPLPNYSSTPQSQPGQDVGVNPDLDPTPEFRPPQPKPQQPAQQTDTTYKRTDIGMGIYLVEGDPNKDGLRDVWVQDSEGTCHTFLLGSGSLHERVASAEVVNQYQGTDGTKTYTCVQIQFRDNSGGDLELNTGHLIPDSSAHPRMTITQGSILKNYPSVFIGYGFREDKISDFFDSFR